MEKTFFNYDSEGHVLCIITKEGEEEEFVEIAPGVNVGLDVKGKVVGIEILNASKFFKPVARSLYQHIPIGKS